MTDLPDYPLSIFRAALASTVGRVLGFAFVCMAASIVPFVVLFLFGEDRIGLPDAAEASPPEMVLGLAMVFFRQVLAGLYQGWGLIASAFLGFLFVAHVGWEWRAGATLLAVFLVGSMESARVEALERGLRFVPLSGILVFLAVWFCGLVALALLLFRRRRAPVQLLPLAGQPKAGAAPSAKD